MKRAIVSTTVAAVLLPALAAGHALLQQASPANGSTVSAAPPGITLIFSEAAHLTALSIQRQGDARAHTIGSLPASASRHFMIALPRLGPGAYAVQYRVVSADDGHISAGTVRFSYSPGASPASADGAAGVGAAGTGAAVAEPGDIRAAGTVQQIDRQAGQVTIAHEPIATLGWPAMTMHFTIKDPLLYERLAVGKRVHFTLAKQGALYVITGVQ